MIKQLYFLMLALLFHGSVFSMESRRSIDRENQLLRLDCERIERAILASKYYPDKQMRNQNIDQMRKALRQKHLQRVCILQDGKAEAKFVTADGGEYRHVL